MSPHSSAIRDEMLALPVDERAELAAELLASLDDGAPADPTDLDREWGSVMTQRSAEIASGECTTVSWDEVLERVAERRRAR